MKGKLYLIPNVLDQGRPEHVISAKNLDLVRSLDFFIVEEEKAARAFLARIGMRDRLDTIDWAMLNEHTRQKELMDLLIPVIQGRSAGLLPEAGCPGVADPGADLVRMAHELDIEVFPLTGPSSVILALMASGLNGQSFAFNGYLPVKQPLRIRRIRELESLVKRNNQTQIFIETPYRNLQLFNDLVNTLDPALSLCIAAELTGDGAWIKTASIGFWKSQSPDIHKRPVVFVIGQ